MAHAQLSLVLRHIRRLAGDGKASDHQLLDRFATQHEEAAFEMLVERHGPAVLGLCRRVLRHEHDAEDVFQATFLTLARKASSIRNPESLGCWLYGVASRLAFKVRAAAAKRRMAETVRHSQKPSAGQELCVALDEELTRLAWRYQAPIVLCCLEGKTREEAARQLGWSPSTLKRRLSQGREILRQRLTRRGLTLSGVLAAVGLAQETVPAALVISTAKTAKAFAMGSIVGLSAKLAEGLLILSKAKIGAMLVLVVSVVGLGVGLIAHQVQLKRPDSASGVAKPEEASTVAQVIAEPMTSKHVAGPVAVAREPLPARAVVRLGTERFRHAHSVTSLGFACEGKWVVSTDWSGLFVWDAATGQQLRRIGGDFGSQLRSASLSADGDRLATMEHERDTLQIWKVSSGELIRQFVRERRHSFAVISPDGNLVASCAQGIIHLSDIANGNELRSWQADASEVSGVAFSPDGKMLVTAGRDKVIHVWDVLTGKELRCLRGHTDAIGKVALSPDGKVLASVGITYKESKLANGGMMRWGNSDNRVHVWEFASGKELCQLTVPREVEAGKSGAFSNGISQMAFTHDSRALATSTTAFKDKSTRIWDIATGKQIAELPVFGGIMAFSPNDKVLATASSGTIRLWNIPSGQEQELGKGHQGPVLSLSVAPNGRLIASGSQDSTVRLWETSTGKELHRFIGPKQAHAVTFSPDGRILASSGIDNTIPLWDVATGEKLRQLRSDQGTWSTPDFTSDGKMVACSNSEGMLCLWNCATGERLREWKGNFGRLCFSLDGKILYSWRDQQVHVWDTATGREIRHFFAGQEERSSTAAFAPNGKWVACGGSYRVVPTYDLASGEEVQRLLVPGDTSCLAFSPDCRTLAWGGADGKPIVLFELASGQIRQRLPGHHGRIHALVFSSDGKFLVSGSADTTGLIWDLMDGARFLRACASLSEPALRACWADLANLDGPTAYDAICKLVASPKDSVPFLAQQLRAVPSGSLRAVPNVLADQETGPIANRGKPMQELERQGDAAEEYLRQFLEKRPSEEVRHRVQVLLEKIERRQGGSGWLQRLRAVEILEKIATSEAREVLQKLAKGAPEARLTQEAKTSLERLAKRP